MYLFIPNKKKIIKSNNKYMAHNLNLPPRPPPPHQDHKFHDIKPPAIRPILSPVSINNIISIKQPILPNKTTTDKIIPITIPNLINLPPPKPIIQPKTNSETQEVILINNLYYLIHQH